MPTCIYIVLLYKLASTRSDHRKTLRSRWYWPGCISPDSDAGPRCSRSLTKMPSLMLPHTLKPSPVKSRLRRLTTLTLVALGWSNKTRTVDCYTADENAQRELHYCVRACVRASAVCFRMYVCVCRASRCADSASWMRSQVRTRFESSTCDDQWTEPWRWQANKPGTSGRRRYTSYSYERGVMSIDDVIFATSVCVTSGYFVLANIWLPRIKIAADLQIYPNQNVDSAVNLISDNKKDILNL